jgi:hypothetical protein
MPVPPQLMELMGGRPPFGSSPLTRPSANLGNAANGAAMVGQAVDMLEKALPEIPPQHPLHKVVLSSISNLSKHAPPQAQSPGVGLQALKQMLAQGQQQSPLGPLLAGAMGGGAGGGMPGVMPPPAGAGGNVVPFPGGGARPPMGAPPAAAAA